MARWLTRKLRGAMHAMGFDVVRHRAADAALGKVPSDLGERTRRIWAEVRPFTMTSPERVDALVGAVEYLVGNGIEGAFVECGVWKGGSAMAMALTLRELGEPGRDLHLFDTFEGMVPPTEADVAATGEPAAAALARRKPGEEGSIWCRAGLDEVRSNMASTGHPAERLHFVRGRVEETLPAEAPETIALLRLDTDWYESTRHELTHLFPRLVPGGVLIVDDYGHWMGQRRAVDEYVAATGVRLLLTRVDGAGRMAVKVGS